MLQVFFLNIINITVPSATCTNTPTIVNVGSKEEMEMKEKKETQSEEETQCEDKTQCEEECVAPPQPKKGE